MLYVKETLDNVYSKRPIPTTCMNWMNDHILVSHKFLKDHSEITMVLWNSVS